jgi:hypothetical protein
MKSPTIGCKNQYQLGIYTKEGLVKVGGEVRGTKE